MNTWILQPVFKVYFVLLISSILSLSCLYTDCSDESHKADSIAEHRLKLRNSIEKEVLNRVKLIIFYLFYFITYSIISLSISLLLLFVLEWKGRINSPNVAENWPFKNWKRFWRNMWNATFGKKPKVLWYIILLARIYLDKQHT